MSDNIYKVLMGDNAPFNGLANKNYFDRTLRGVIEKIHYELYEQNEETGKLDLQQFGYRTVDIRWLEAKPYISTYVKIPEIISMQGYGLNYLPSVGDIVVASFDSKNYPIIQNIYSRAAAFEHGILSNETQLPELNNYGDPLIDTAIKKEIRPTPIRYIVPGEISLTSLNLNNELYFDKYGTAKLIARVPNLTSEMGEQCGDRIWEISTGKEIVDETTGFVKQSSFGNLTQYQIYGHNSGLIINGDDKGNLEIINRGCIIKIDETGEVNISTGNSGRTPYILGSKAGKFKTPMVSIENNQVKLMLSSDGQNYDIYNSALPVDVAPNNQINISIEYQEDEQKKGNYKIVTPKKTIELKDKPKLFNNSYWWLLNNSSNYECFNAGKIDLSKIKLTIDGKVKFDGSTAKEFTDYTNNGCKEDSKSFTGGMYKYVLIKEIFDFSTATSWKLDLNYTQLDGESVKIDKNTITLGNGETQKAVLGNNLENLLVKLISAFNSHTHTGNMGFPTTPPDITVNMENILSDTVEIK